MAFDRVRRTIMVLGSIGHSYFGPLSRPVQIALVVPYALSLAFITSIGGTLQNTIFRSLTGEAPSLYGSVYADAIMRFPGLADWVLSGLHWTWLACGLLISAMAIPQRFVGRILLTTALAAPFGLILSDLLSFPIRDAINTENVIGNLLGGPLAAIAASPGLLIFAAITAGAKPGSIRVATASFAMIVWGILVCVAAYAGFAVLFQPVSQQFEVVLGRPLTGMTYASVSFDGSKKGNRFSFLPKDQIGGESSINGRGERLKIQWKPLRSERFTVSAFLLIDCWPGPTKNLPVGRPFLKVTGVSFVSGSLNTETTFVQTTHDTGASYLYEPRLPSSYWVSDAGKDKLKITHFVSPKDVIEAQISADTAVTLTGAMLRSAGNVSIPVERTLDLQIGPEKYQVLFAKPIVGRRDRALKCHVGKPHLQNGRFSSDEQAMLAGVLLKFEPERPRTFFAARDAKLRVAGASGWFSVDQIPIDGLSRGTLGKTGFLTFSGPIESFRLDGKDVEHRNHDTFAAIGDLKASWLNDGKLRIQGAVGRLWRGPERLSPTRWERMPLELKLALLPFLVGFGGLVEYCRRTFKKFRNAEIVATLR